MSLICLEGLAKLRGWEEWRVVRLPRSVHKIRLLFVEDDLDDVELAQAALAESFSGAQLRVAHGEAEAIRLLGQKDYLPDLVLLDLSLPESGALKVLEWIKSQDRVKIVPVIVLSATVSKVDIASVYGRHANCLVTKPVNCVGFSDLLAKLFRFWFGVVRLPTRTSGSRYN